MGEKVTSAGSMSATPDPATALAAARKATEEAKAATLARLDSLEQEKALYLKDYGDEKMRLKVSLRTREYKPRAPKP